MISSDIEGVKISGIACALPERKVVSDEYNEIFSEETVKKTVELTGVESTYHSVEKQTASDLAYAAAKHLLLNRHIDPSEIGVLLFVGSHHDYIAPATAFVLQKRLEIPMNAIVFDINLGCSGFVYGLHTGASLLKSTNAKKALVLLGDSSSRVVSPDDTSRLLFGDSGAALLIEKTESAEDIMKFGFRSDGARFEDIYIPGGGYRHMDATRDLHEEEDGHRRSDYHSHMNGTEVFVFSVTDVPRLVRDFMSERDLEQNDIDMLFMHQPNLFILKNIVRKLKLPKEKVPFSIGKFGNTSGVSIPITMCDYYADRNEGVKKMMLLGFGIGLSWGIAYLPVDTNVILPVIHSDEYYEDGLMNRS